MTLKPLSKEAVPRALAKAERYRFLNDPSAAESIYRDVLSVDHGNQEAVRNLILCLADQFGDLTHRVNIQAPIAVINDLTSEYERIYYRGIICERWAKAILLRSQIGVGAIAYNFLREAMDWYEKAQKLHEAGNEDSILRWNSCARTIEAHKLSAPVGDSSSHSHD